MRILNYEIAPRRVLRALRASANRAIESNRFLRSYFGGLTERYPVTEGESPLGNRFTSSSRVRPHNPYGTLGNSTLSDLTDLRRYSRALLRESEYGGWVRRVLDDVLPYEQRPPTFADVVPKDLAEEIGEAWMDFWACGEGVDGAGLSGVAQERAAMWALIEDGDAFCIPYLLGGRMMLEARNGGDLYDYHHTMRTKSGKRVYLGVEMNDRMFPTAYWFRSRDKTSGTVGLASQGMARRVAARNVVHAFERISTDSFRGIPWITPSLIQALQLKEADRAMNEIMRLTSRVPWAIKSQPDAVGSYQSLHGASSGGSRGREDIISIAGDDGREEDALQKIRVGDNTVLELAPGKELYHPAASVGAMDTKGFREKIQKSISAGLMLSYARVSGDVASANFSALRAGEIDDMAHHRSIHGLWVSQWRAPIFRRWLLWAAARGDIKLPADDKVMRALDKPNWILSRRGWVDPVKEARAQQIYVDMGVLRADEVRRAMGYPADPELAALADEKFKNMVESGVTPARVEEASPSGNIADGDGNPNNEDDGK